MNVQLILRLARLETRWRQWRRRGGMAFEDMPGAALRAMAIIFRCKHAYWGAGAFVALLPFVTATHRLGWPPIAYALAATIGLMALASMGSRILAERMEEILRDRHLQ